jgi:hypothetical protein
MQAQLMVGVRVRAEAAAVLVLGISKYLLVTRAGDLPSLSCILLLRVCIADWRYAVSILLS